MTWGEAPEREVELREQRTFRRRAGIVLIASRVGDSGWSLGSGHCQFVFSKPVPERFVAILSQGTHPPALPPTAPQLGAIILSCQQSS